MTCTYYSSFREHTMQQQHDLALCLYQLFALIYYLCAFAQTINNIMIIYIYIYIEVCLWLFLVCGIPQFCLFVTWSACFVTCSTIVCYMVNHGRLHGRSLSVTQQSIVCYIVEHCVLHGRALYVTWWACFVTWQIIVCYMVELCLYKLEHCLSHHRALFVTTSRSFVVQSKIWCVTWKTIICYGEMCVALLHGR